MRWIETNYNGETKRVPLARQPISVGRSADCDLSFPTDKQISRIHAIIEPRPNGWFVVDQKSTNGSLVNGQRVTVPFPIKEDDVIQIGDQRLRVCSGVDLVVPESFVTRFPGYPHYYIILKVHPSASSEEIQNAYDQLSAIFDPNLHPNRELIKVCREEIEEAFAMLSDPEKRQQYDKILPASCFVVDEALESK